jgi:hypothetical protein
MSVSAPLGTTAQVPSLPGRPHERQAGPESAQALSQQYESTQGWPLVQSVPALQRLPWGQGAHRVPPQSTSVSSPSFMWSWQAAVPVPVLLVVPMPPVPVVLLVAVAPTLLLALVLVVMPPVPALLLVVMPPVPVAVLVVAAPPVHVRSSAQSEELW